MTPGARVAAAIEILDTIIAGEATEAALTRWARGSRFAGSKDRAAVRDHVFDGVRNLRSYACAGGASGAAPNGRAVMIGAARAQLSDISEWFSGQGYAPSTVLESEVGIAPETQADRWNVPDWLCDEISASLGDGADAYAALSGQRAPITLRVNVAKTSLEDAQARLLKDGIACEPNPAAKHALSVTSGARAVRNSGALHDGWIELQDAHSQAVIEEVPLAGVQTALDFCAGYLGR